MQFALLGDHPDGLEMARALTGTGRHRVILYHGPAVGAEFLRRWGMPVQSVGDIEELLADPRVQAVIVAGSLDERPAQLRRALQAERHVVSVHPSDQTPDMAYEAAMIQGDTHCVLLPLLPEGLHPGIKRLAEIGKNEALVGTRRLIEMERASSEVVLLQEGRVDSKVSVPGWDMLRAVGGEVAEVSAFAATEKLSADQPALVSGSFADGGLFRASFFPGQHESMLRLAVIGSYARTELSFPSGWPGPSTLQWWDEAGNAHSETTEEWNPWLPVIEAFEVAVARPLHSGAAAGGSSALSWQDEIRALELDDAARRSVHRRRVSALEYPDATESAGFKGTMTLVGCGLIWVILILVILSLWFPSLGWAILPVLLFFLGLQVLRWLVPAAEEQGMDKADAKDAYADSRPST